MADFGLLLVKALASLFSIAMMLSPALQIRRVYTEKHTGEVALLPLAGLFLCCHTWCVPCPMCRRHVVFVRRVRVGSDSWGGGVRRATPNQSDTDAR